MTQNAETIVVETEEVVDDTEGAQRYAAYVKKLKKDKTIRRVVFASAIVGAAALALKYVHTPVSDEEPSNTEN